ncbi:MAG TPA: DivIVA domain-containing protein [Mycobacteriales bacterium]|nr:DivIVA domain-containing protein [Mycobacteriales bacterium]
MGVILAVAVGVAVLIGIALLLAVTDQPMSDEPVDRLDSGLPDSAADGLLRAADIPRLRFRVGLRGYRMDDVDAALARIQAALARAEGGQPGGEAVGPGAVEPAAEAD